MEFNLNIAPRITKELLLSKNSQESYFEHYLGVHVKKGLFCCPPILRSDKNPTCSFYKNSRGNLIFKDFGNQELNFDFIGCVMYIFSCSYYIALKTIANDFNIVKTDVPKNEPKIAYSGTELKETTQSNIQVEIKDFSEKELKWWGSFSISLNTLKKFKVFSIKHVFLNGNYHTTSTESSPIFGYYGGKNSDGIELWRLYMPNKTKYRFLSNWKATMIQGAKQLPKHANFIVITKSLKDVMALYEFGITAIAPNSENLFLSEKQYEKVKERYEKVFILYDRDLPGIRSVKRFKKMFKDLQVLIMPKCKDFTDYVKKHNTLKVFELIDKAKEYYL